MTQPPGRLVAALAERYTIGRELGRGGMATVYLAHDLRHDRPVALKVLRPELAHSLGPERFLREIRVTARLDHPGILPLLDSGSADGFLYYVMPYVEGESLRDRLNRERQLPVGDALQIVRDVADALGYAHGRGIVHRDIKPENILLSGKHARVADFGIAFAVAAAGAERLTDPGLAMGTAAYMSPEQATGSTDLDGRSDLYSLGCVTYEMFAGEPPFSGTNPQALLARKSLETARPLRPVRPAVPPHIEDAVLAALAPVPADRFATMAEFVERLSITAPVRSVAMHKVLRSPRTFITSVALVALAILGIWWKVSQNGQPIPEVSATRIAVFPFLVDDPQLGYWREGLMDLLSSALDGAGEIQRVDPFILTSHLRTLGEPAVADLETASRVARHLGAGRFLLGRVVPSGKSVQIVASLYAGVDPTRPEHQFIQTGFIDSMPSLVAALARDVLLNVPTGPGTWVTKETAPPTLSLAALRAYSRGEAMMRRFKPDSAATAFREALSSDSAFALAWLRLAFAEDFRIDDSAMVFAIDRAMHFAHRLGPRDRMLAEVVSFQSHGNSEGAERAALELVAAYPGYGEAWYRLGIARLWAAWKRGRPPSDAGAALEQALVVDPEHRQALNALAWISAHEGRRSRADSFRQRATGIGARRMPSDSTAVAEYLNRAASWNTAALGGAVLRAAWRSDDRLPEASQLASLLTDSTRRPRAERSIGHLFRGRIEAAAGRWGHAEKAFRDADAEGLGLGLLEAGWLASIPLMHVGVERRRLIRDSLARLPIPAAYIDQRRSTQAYTFPGLLEPWLVPHARYYVLGLLSAGLGDELESTGYATLLRNVAEPSDSIGLLRDLSLEIQALLVMQNGDAAHALAILDSTGMRLGSHYQVFASPFHMRPVTRILRAQALASLGRDREAIGWYAGLGWSFFPSEWVFLAQTNMAQGELYERLGEPERAGYHYGRFIARWENADSIQQPLVRDVRRRLALLEGKSGS